MGENIFELMDKLFKFKVGDIVNHKAAQVIKLDTPGWGSRDMEVRLFIVERTAQQCPGGVQFHYITRAVTKDGNFGPYVTLNECELQAAEPFAPKIKEA